MSELPMRANEISMRISLIVALACNPHAKFIEAEHIKWAQDYMRQRIDEIIEKLKVTISHSDFEHSKKEILADLREKGEEGVTKTQSGKQPPYSKYKPRELKEIMDALKDTDLVGEEAYQNPKGGRSTVKWIALK